MPASRAHLARRSLDAGAVHAQANQSNRSCETRPFARSMEPAARPVLRGWGRVAMGEITELLARARTESDALGRVFVLLYDELRRVAKSSPGRSEKTLSPTVLIHEAYLRLVGNTQLVLNDRHHFMACAARAMRVIWVDHVRRSTALKRGGPLENLHIDVAELVPSAMRSGEDMIVLDQALDQLDVINSRQREVVELRYFGGLEFTEIAKLLDCSERTAKREWERARAFLYAQMQ
jgi:RNA polymerase sigma factor (TIGR02999 family)